MALHWEWSNKCGEITLEQNFDGEWKKFPITLYTGNAFLIMLHEFEENGKDMYELYGFFADKAHAKNCLGLNKKDGYTDNIYKRDWQKWSKVRINKAKYDKYKDLVQMLAQAFDDITIEIYTEE